MQKQLLALENENVNKLILKYSIPSITGLLVTASYTIFDRIFVGKGIGSLALTGISITFPIIMIIMAFSMLIGIGATALVSIKLGEKNKEEAEHIAGNAILLAIIVSLILTVILFLFLEEILILFGAEGAALGYAADFMSFLLPGTVIQILLFTMNNLIRGEGNPKTAMFTLFISSIINVILNPIFIFIFHWGIKGSAIATVIAQFISLIWVVAYFFGKRSILKLSWKNLIPNTIFIKKIFSIGMASFTMHVIGSVVFIVFNAELKFYGGDIAVASLGIVNSIATLFLMPIFGINQGIQPILGYNFGAKKYDRLQDTLKASMIIATIVCLTGFVVILFFSEFIVNLFSKNDYALIYNGSHGLRMFTLLFPVIGFQIVAVGYFQAIGKAKHSLFFTLLRQALFLIPALLILPGFLNLDGVWIAGPVSDGFSAVVMVLFLLNEWRYLEEQKGIKELRINTAV